MPSALETAVTTFRRRLRQREDDAVRQLVADYRAVDEAVREELLSVLRALEVAPPEQRLSLLFRRDRLVALERDIAAEIGRVTGSVYQTILADRLWAARVAADDVLRLIDAAMGGIPASAGISLRRMDAATVEQIAGVLQPGSPLRQIIDRLPAQAAERFRQETVRGVILGRAPRETARMTSAALGGNLARAITISRTETLRAYRAATLEGYRENRNVVKGWRWSASLDMRTCPTCWAQHGSFHTLEESFASHPSCRCAMVPETKTWAELGLPDITAGAPPMEQGEDVFRRQSDAFKLAVLGPAKFAAYRAGRIDLQSLVQPTYSPQWGAGVAERSLVSLVGAADAARFAAAGRKAS